jgi:hypothetical protein
MGSHPAPPPAPLSAQARKLRNLMFAALGLLVVLNLFIHPHEPHFGLDAYLGFWAVFGLAGAVILGRAAKGLAHTVLGKNEDFYEEGSKDSRGQGVK